MSLIVSAYEEIKYTTSATKNMNLYVQIKYITTLWLIFTNWMYVWIVNKIHDEKYP